MDANNHINSSSTFAYDAAGNMYQDGKGTGYSYSFDAENRLVLAGGMSGGPYCYVYDGNGLRVAKKSGANADCSGGTVTKLYWRSLSGDALAETDGTGSTTNAAYNEYVFFAGRRIAQRNGPGAIFYYFADQLGSTRTITTGSGPGQTPGQLCYDADFTPYGQELSHTERLQTTACPPNYKFTGDERDPETGLDYAFARYYSSSLGRFLSTDPLGGSVGNLQSHNGYAYVVNNPLNAVDPSGMCAQIRDADGNFRCYGSCPQCVAGTFFGWDIFTMLEIPVYGYGFMQQNWSSSTGEPVDPTYAWGYGLLGYGLFLGFPSGSLMDQLANLLKNPDCAALLGGEKTAAMVMAHLNSVVNVDTQNGTSPNFVQAKKDIDSPGGPAAETLVPAKTDGYIVNGTWTGGNFNIYVGSTFASYSNSAQLTVLVHESIHAATTGKINQWMVDLQTANAPGMYSPRMANIYAIHKNCGTDLPPKY